MTILELTVGQPYIVAGQGELLLEAVDGNMLTFLTHGNFRMWSRASSVVRRATPADIAARRDRARVRNVDCNSPDCWCGKFLAMAKEQA